ncbi:MAG: UPF0489 family protein [Akkermansia sp.]|nr:UPF0489 family protein [Akkermansia sp.]
MPKIIENLDCNDAIYSEVPEYCFEHRNTSLYKIDCSGKSIYVFECHSAALKAWKEITSNHPIDVITFDEHTDTHPPLWGYCVHALKHDEDALVRLLDASRVNQTDNFISGLYQKIDAHSTPYFDFRMLKHDEHITTAVYWNIIRRAYICASRSSRPEILVSNVDLLNVYNNIIQVKDVFTVPNYPEVFRKCDFFEDFVELHRKMSVNLDDETINRITRQIPLSDDFILDIDLDYFQTPFILDRPFDSMPLFCRLIQKAKAITIATETECVQEQVDKYSSIYNRINETCMSLSCKNPLRKGWDSRKLLQYLLELIEYVLSGQWEKECKQEEINKTIRRRMLEGIDESAKPLISAASKVMQT